MVISIEHLIWVSLTGINLLIQILYFFNDRSTSLYLGKRITTPLLLFGAMALILTGGHTVFSIPPLLLGLMGLGELGIEGSSVVEDRGDGFKPSTLENIMVTLAGIIFLAVNFILGISLLIDKSIVLVAGTGLFSLIVFFLVNLLFLKRFTLSSETTFQTRVYSIGLVVLLSGALADGIGGFSLLGVAALILTFSDTLVLIRMAAGWDKKTVSGNRILLFFLVTILLLYYLYMAVLISTGVPFLC
jgi:hypothetical protein